VVRKRKASQSVVQRARIVLARAEGSGTVPLTAVAARLDVSREMVRKWRVRFAEDRLEGLTDAPRPGAPRKITDEQVAAQVRFGVLTGGALEAGQAGGHRQPQLARRRPGLIGGD